MQAQIKETSKFRVTGLVRGIHGWLVNSTHKWPKRRKCFNLMTSLCRSKCKWILPLWDRIDYYFSLRWCCGTEYTLGQFLHQRCSCPLVLLRQDKLCKWTRAYVPSVGSTLSWMSSCLWVNYTYHNFNDDYWNDNPGYGIGVKLHSTWNRGLISNQCPKFRLTLSPRQAQLRDALFKSFLRYFPIRSNINTFSWCSNQYAVESLI